MLIHPIRIESLGNTSYMVISEAAKACAVIDPVRDVDMYVAEAERRGVRIAYSLETHVHNDFVSGSRELAARTGAKVCASAAGGLLFDHRPLKPGDVIELGEARLEVVPTPGHTPEHISFLATDTAKEGGPHAIFSGGALLVGGVARTDLLGKDLAPFLGRWLHRTIQQTFAKMPDNLMVYPTHGGGSFCLANAAGSSAQETTIGQERTSNPYFQAASEREFIDLALDNLPSYPAYYGRMADVNVRGPRILGGVPTLHPLTPRETWVRLQRDAVAVDARAPEEYASAHIPDAYSVPYAASAGTWVGWVVADGAPLVIVLDDEAERADLVRQLMRIGYDDLEGYLEGGIKAWRAADLPFATVQIMTPRQLSVAMDWCCSPDILDVRFGYEWDAGRIAGAKHIELGELQGQVGALPRERQYATVCAAGVRASTAASILERAGMPDITVLKGGMNAWRKMRLPVEE